MQSTLPGLCEVVVTSLHGSAAISDGEYPVNISPSSQGAIITPRGAEPYPSLKVSTDLTQDGSGSIGKVHFPLPTLRSLEEETTLGKLTGYAIASTRLEVLISPHVQSAVAKEADSTSKIIRVGLYAGRDEIKCWGHADDSDLPTNQDMRLSVDSDIVGAGETFSDNPRGLCVTMTANFADGVSCLLISSVALVQTVGPRRKT